MKNTFCDQTPKRHHTHHTGRAARRHRGAVAALVCIVGGGFSHAASAETDREYCERQEGPAKTVCMRDLDKAVAKPAVAATTAAAKPAVAATTAAATPAVAATTPAATPAVAATTPAATGATAAAPAGAAQYKVVDGYHVDPFTLKGFQTWRAAACDRCHGANQEGLVGPSLVNSLKTLSQEEFAKTVTQGRLEKGMPSFAGDATLIANLPQLYTYLKGRSDGAITKAHVMPIE